MSATTRSLKVGVAEAPLAGPANTVLAASLTKDRARVPDVVTGLPETEKIEGAVKATLVTVPPELGSVLVIVVVPPVLLTLIPVPPTIVWLGLVLPLMLVMPLPPPVWAGYSAYWPGIRLPWQTLRH